MNNKSIMPYLNNTEKTNFEKSFEKLKNSNIKFNKPTCIKLMKDRGGLTEDDSNLIWDKCSLGTKEIDKENFFLMMRYMSAAQNGYPLIDINIYEISNLPTVKFTNKKKKEENTEQMTISQIPIEETKEKKKIVIEKNIENSEISVVEKSVDIENTEKSLELIDRGFENKENKEVIEHKGINENNVKIENFENEDIVDLNQTNLLLEKKKVSFEKKPEEKPEITFDNDVYKSIVVFKNMNNLAENNKKVIDKINILGHEERKDGLLGKSYTVFKIAVKYNGKNFLCERRFSDFEWLHKYLSNHSNYQGIILPKLPEKHTTQYLTSFFKQKDEKFLEDRQKELENYLSGVAAHKNLKDDKIYLSFLINSNDDFQNLKANLNPENTVNYSFSGINDLFTYATTYLKTSISYRLKNKKELNEIVDIEPLEIKIERIQKIEKNITKTKQNISKIIAKHKENYELYFIAKENYIRNDVSANDPIYKLSIYQQQFSILQEDYFDKKLDFIIKKIQAAKIAYDSLINAIYEYYFSSNLYRKKNIDYWAEQTKNNTIVNTGDSNELSKQREIMNMTQKKIQKIYENLKKELEIFEEGLCKEIVQVMSEYEGESKRVHGNLKDLISSSEWMKIKE